MGGNIAISSEQGKGTDVYFCVTFELPGDGPIEKKEIQGHRPKFVDRKGIRLLLAEDDHVSGVTLKKQLEKAGYEVTVVENGSRAISEMKRKDYQAVLMDVQMPVMDGIEATRVIRDKKAGEKNSRIPIIAVTAYAMRGDEQKFLDAGMDGYISKPVDSAELMRELERLLVKAG
jgi:CheY-like chemotaxis protein